MTDTNVLRTSRLRVLEAPPPRSRIDAVRDMLATLDLPASLALLDLETVTGRLLKTTVSICPICLEHAPAAVFPSKGRVLMRKRCDAHGLFDSVLENDQRFYFLSNRDTSGRRFAADRVFDIPAFSPAASGACCAAGSDCAPSTDQMSNKTCTILVEVTDACNMSCPVCYSDAKGERGMPLSTFKRYIQNLIARKGALDSVQLTGGEALLHPEFWEMVAFLHGESGVKKIYLPTNGLILAQEGAIDRLRPFASKLMVLLQFDGSETADRALRGASPGKARARVLGSLRQARIHTQLTMTLSRGINLEDVDQVLDVGIAHENVKVIAFQPATYSGRYELAPDPMERLTLSDVAKAATRKAGLRLSESDFLPIPCSHPNCGWITLFVRRFGVLYNIIRHVDLPRIVDDVAHRTLLSTRDLRRAVGTARSSAIDRIAGALGKRLIRSEDIFTIAIKPFMDRHTYDQDRVASCCHHLLDTKGTPVSFCEYNALRRATDTWDHWPRLEHRSG